MVFDVLWLKSLRSSAPYLSLSSLRRKTATWESAWVRSLYSCSLLFMTYFKASLFSGFWISVTMVWANIGTRALIFSSGIRVLTANLRSLAFKPFCFWSIRLAPLSIPAVKIFSTWSTRVSSCASVNSKSSIRFRTILVRWSRHMFTDNIPWVILLISL